MRRSRTGPAEFVICCPIGFADQRTRALLAFLLAALVALSSGCGTTRYITKRPTRENSLANTLNLLSRKGPQLQERTSLVLRRYSLADEYEQSPALTLQKLHAMASDAADTERQFAVAELAYIEGKKAERGKQIAVALDYYSSALISSYEYLFARQFETTRSAYDPQFRGACDLYNEALEDSLRLLCEDHRLKPGQTYTISAGERQFTIETVMRGGWEADEFDHFEFVSDYQIEVLNNRHRTFGIGVPLVAVRRPPAANTRKESFYPEGLSFPVTALLRAVPNETANDTNQSMALQPTNQFGTPLNAILETKGEEGEQSLPRLPRNPRCVLEFFDPLSQNEIYLANQWVPLQTDLTTPLAFFLDTPQFRERNSATRNLLYTNQVQDSKGLFMLEPYDPERIPVVMVHGLWSSPLTWMDMFNDLRSFPEIRERYQFWFYLYPTGQPFWISATQMRQDLAKTRESFDPGREHAAIDQMVLVGHSMGGLVSRMQAIDSGDDFWRIVSDKPVDQLRGDPDDIHKLVSTLTFKPNASVSRVITIATPHRGSEFANPYTQWLAKKFIELPRMVIGTGSRLVRNNPGVFKDTELLTTDTSIDSLSPDSEIFPVMLRAKSSPRVRYHNIIGVSDKGGGIMGSGNGASDGVVSLASAEFEEAVSELRVNADHVSIHTKPESILEVRRILMQHLREIDRNDRVAQVQGSAAGEQPQDVASER